MTVVVCMTQQGRLVVVVAVVKLTHCVDLTNVLISAAAVVAVVVGIWKLFQFAEVTAVMITAAVVVLVADVDAMAAVVDVVVEMLLALKQNLQLAVEVTVVGVTTVDFVCCTDPMIVDNGSSSLS